MEIIQAQLRALSLLSEPHQPLTMSPGDLRRLLARYQRGLSELSEAIGPPEGVTLSKPAHAITAEEATSRWQLRATWHDMYDIKLVDGLWSASLLTDRTMVLTADTATALKALMQKDEVERSRAHR